MPADDNKNGSNGGPWGGKPPKKNTPPPFSNPNELDDLLKKGQDRVKHLFSDGGPKGPTGFPKIGAALIVIVALVVWLASGIYTVNTKEEGVVLRFGEYVRTAGPGLNYHLPTPIERVIKLRVTDRYKEEIGYRSANTSRSSDREILMLTGDENIIDINFEVQWQISDARKFLFNINDPQKTIRDAAESAMREVIGTTPISAILSEGRSVAQLETKQLLQETLDSYDAGVEIREINMKGVPPSTVVEAFKDVQAAKINKQETINKAKAYHNEVIPIARGEAEALIQQAEGYKQRVIADAEGQAERFIQVYNKYKGAKYVTRKRMYLETMENVLDGMDKMIVDDKIGGVVPYLPLNDLKNKSKVQ